MALLWYSVVADCHDNAPHISQDRDAEIAGLLERGATRVDSEGNDFCVLSSRDR